MQVDDGDHYLMTKEELENKIATFTGGRVARGAECPGVRKSYYETTMHMRDWCFLALWGIVTAAVLCVGGVKI